MFPEKQTVMSAMKFPCWKVICAHGVMINGGLPKCIKHQETKTENLDDPLGFVYCVEVSLHDKVCIDKSYR